MSLVGFFGDDPGEMPDHIRKTVQYQEEVNARYKRIDDVLKKTIAADLTAKLTWSELSMLIAFTNNVCRLPPEYEQKIEAVLQKHGFLGNQAPSLNGLA